MKLLFKGALVPVFLKHHACIQFLRNYKAFYTQDGAPYCKSDQEHQTILERHLSWSKVNEPGLIHHFSKSHSPAQSPPLRSTQATLGENRSLLRRASVRWGQSGWCLLLQLRLRSRCQFAFHCWVRVGNVEEMLSKEKEGSRCSPLNP